LLKGRLTLLVHLCFCWVWRGHMPESISSLAVKHFVFWGRVPLKKTLRCMLVCRKCL
jgi:hypothetical protein